MSTDSKLNHQQLLLKGTSAGKWGLETCVTHLFCGSCLFQLKGENHQLVPLYYASKHGAGRQKGRSYH